MGVVGVRKTRVCQARSLFAFAGLFFLPSKLLHYDRLPEWARGGSVQEDQVSRGLDPGLSCVVLVMVLAFIADDRFRNGYTHPSSPALRVPGERSLFRTDVAFAVGTVKVPSSPGQKPCKYVTANHVEILQSSFWSTCCRHCVSYGASVFPSPRFF